jgi:hypothetical protein
VFYFEVILKTRLLVSTTLLLMGHSAVAANLDDALQTFEDNPGYSSPLATYMGTLQNSGWVRSARINRGFGFGMGIDFNLAYLSGNDTEYSWNRKTNCEKVKADNPSVSGSCEDSQTYLLPTIFGGSTEQRLLDYEVENSRIVENTDELANEGIVSEDGVLGLPNWLFLPTAYLNFQLEHTEAKIRTMYLPISLAGHEFSYGLFALGFQHDISHYHDNKMPVDLSVVANWSMWGISYTNEEYSGVLELDGLVQNYGIVVGKKWGMLELTGEAGWEFSSFDATGEMTHESDEREKDVSAGVTVEGLNGFRAAINLTVHFGSYQLFAGQSLGAQRGNTFNFINYNKESSPDKEK